MFVTLMEISENLHQKKGKSVIHMKNLNWKIQLKETDQKLLTFD